MNTDKSIELAPKNDMIYVKQTQLSYIWYKSYSFKMIAEFWIVEGYKMGKHSEVLWKGKQNTVKILKIGTPEIITIIVLQLEQLDFTVQYCVQKMQTK